MSKHYVRFSSEVTSHVLFGEKEGQGLTAQFFFQTETEKLSNLSKNLNKKIEEKNRKVEVQFFNVTVSVSQMPGTGCSHLRRHTRKHKTHKKVLCFDKDWF